MGDFSKDQDLFEQVFKIYFKSLRDYAFLLLRDETEAGEAVQQVFYRIWEKKKNLIVHSSVKAYLYKAVHNQCLLQLKRKNYMDEYRNHMTSKAKSEAEEWAFGKTEHKELEMLLYKAMNRLPAQCRIIFQLNRFEGLSYQEVAAELNLSVKTIENQMGKALKRLRHALAEFLPLIIFLLCRY